MAGLRVFVSSTCVDLSAHRDQLRVMLNRMGYEPVMSDYSDVLYDPNLHTHTSCVKDMASADMVVLMIGARFGGTAVPDVLPYIDFDSVDRSVNNKTILTEREKLSITQLELLKAIELEIPVFAFVDRDVYADHHVYQANKASGVADKIKYPSVEKPEVAKYIFEFINLITHRINNNSIISFDSFYDIENHLLKQWSMLFQRILREQRENKSDQRRADFVVDQIEGLKAAVLQSISVPHARETAKAVIRFRRLVDFLVGLNKGPGKVDIAVYRNDFDEMLKQFGIAKIEAIDDSGNIRTALVKSDDRFYMARMPPGWIDRLSGDWEKFKELEIEVKKAVVDAVSEAEGPIPLIRYQTENFSDYKLAQSRERPLVLTVEHLKALDVIGTKFAEAARTAAAPKASTRLRHPLNRTKTPSAGSRKPKA